MKPTATEFALHLDGTIDAGRRVLGARDGALRLLDALAPYGADTMTHGRGVKEYSREGAAELVTGKLPALGVSIGRSASPGWHLRFKPRDPTSGIAMLVQFTLDGSDQIAAVIHVLQALCGNGEARTGWCHPTDDPYMRLAEDRNSDWARWIEVLGADTVRALGEAYVRETPAHAVLILESGGALVQAFPNPADFATDAARDAIARVTAHLARKAPSVVRDEIDHAMARVQLPATIFHSAVDAVLQLGIRMQPEPERRAYIEKWNAREPDALAFSTAAHEVPASDVSDVPAWTSRLELLAEQLRALMQSRTSVYPREMLDRLADAVGAFFGTVLVERAGGRWVPRADLHESAVVAGDRAWWPFQRARSFVRSPDDAILYSLSAAFQRASVAG